MIRRILTTLGFLLFATSVQAGNITVCASSCNWTLSQLQNAIDAAVPGDVILIDHTASITGNFILRNKGALGNYITITSDASAINLPAAGVRTGPSFTAYLPKLKAASGTSQFTTEPGANHYKFTHLEFLNVPDGRGSILELGDATATTIANLPHDFIIDQCWFKGDEVDGQLRGIAWNAGAGEVTNSYFEQISAVGAEGQCIAGWNAMGPLTIQNNYLECAAINIIFGGSDPALRWRLTTTGGATTTGAAVVLAEGGGRTIADLAVGDLLAIDVATGPTVTLEFVTLQTITGIGGGNTTATISWSPALSAIPDTTASSIRHDAQMKTLRVTRNYIVKDPAWRNPILGIPAGPSAVLSAGGSLAGAKYYKVVAYANGYQANPIQGLPSTEVTATAGGGNGTITISVSAVTGADTYRYFRGTTPGGENEYYSSASNSLADTGALTFTGATIPSTGTKWTVKNLFELKSASDAIVSSNILEYLWEDTNSGARQAIWSKSENQNDGGGCWTCTLRQFTFEKNIVRHVFGFLSVQGRYAVNGAPIVYPAPTTDTMVRNNLVYDCNGTTWGENPADSTWVMLLQSGLVNFTLDHNTIICPGMTGMMAIDGNFPHVNFVLTNNLTLRGLYGIFASGSSEGNAALNLYAPSRTISKNAIGGVQEGNFSVNYPTNNFYPTETEWQAAFTAYVASGVAADFHVKADSAYHLAGTDGKDLGVDVDLVLSATDGVDDGSPLNPLTITTTSLATGTATVAYTQTVVAVYGTAPYTFAKTVGTLPTGLTLNASTGVLSGIPTVIGDYTFTIAATDNVGAITSRDYTVSIYRLATGRIGTGGRGRPGPGDDD